MKKLIGILLLVILTITGHAQSKWDGFLKPVPPHVLMYRSSFQDKAITTEWLVRPKAYVTAVQLNWDKEKKGFNTSALSSAGLGIGLQCFKDVNGEAYNVYGFNGLILFGYDVAQPEEPATMAFALTVSALQVINVGCLYTFIGPDDKKAFGLLMGVNVKF